MKYAALDANINPGANLPDRFFGTIVNGTYVGGFSVTGMQSLLAHFETGLSELPGLSQFPTSTWPPLLVHTTFNIMTVGGIALGLFFFAYFVGILRRKKPNESRLFLILWIPLAVLAAIVYELGWATDEIGRQPWIVYNVMSVGQAANTSPSIFVPGILVVLFYLLMVPSAFYLYARVFKGRVGQQEV